MSGTGSVTKINGGTLTLQSVNAYSGGTNVNGGLLVVSVGATLGSGGVNVNGGTLDVTQSPLTVGSIKMGSVGTLNLAAGNPLTATGTASFGGVLNLSGAPTGSVTDLIDYASFTGAFAYVAGVSYPYVLQYTPTQLDLVQTVSGVSVWKTAAGGSWMASANWTPNNVPNGQDIGAVINAPTTSPVTITLDGRQTLGGLLLGNSAGSTTGYTLSAGASGSLTFSNSTIVPAITVTGGSHVISAPVILAGGLSVSPASGATLDISGPISQSSVSALTLSGAGELILSGSNSYSGGTTISGGTLQIGNGGSGASIGATSGVLNNGSLVFDHSDAVTFSPSISGSGGLIKQGSGAFTLAGTNTYTGDTIINRGILILAQPLAVQNSTVNVSSSGALNFAAGIVNPTLGGLAGGGNIALATAASEPVVLNVGQNGQSTTYSGDLSGAGGLTKIGAGVLTLTAPQSYDGPTVINDGMLKFQPVKSGGIGIHFVGSGSPVSGSAGVVPMGNWNNLSGSSFTSTALTDNSGASTNSKLTISANGIYASGSSNQLFNGYIYDNSYTQLSATISGIPYAKYSLYAYMADANSAGIGEKLTIGGTTYYYGMTNSASYTQVTNTISGVYPAGNYVVATGLTAGAETVTVQGDDQQYSSITGFEIVNTANSLPIASSLTINSSAGLDLAGNSQQVASLSDYSPGNGGSIINSNTSSASVLTLSPTSGSTTFSGMIQGGGTSGAISLVLSGSGTQVLSGSDTYTGGTTIDAGKLILTSGGALPDRTSLTVAAGGTLIFDPSASGSPVTNLPSAVAVPEPSTSVLLGVGAISLLGCAWRKLRASRPTIHVAEGDLDTNQRYLRRGGNACLANYRPTPPGRLATNSLPNLCRVL